jgi:hypothetical protein
MNPSFPINNKEQKDLKEEPMMIGRSQSIWYEDLEEEKEEDDEKKEEEPAMMIGRSQSIWYEDLNEEKKEEEPAMMIGRSQSIWQEEDLTEEEDDEKKEHLAQEYHETKCCQNIDYVYDYIYEYVKENQLKEAFVQSTPLNCSEKHLL